MKPLLPNINDISFYMFLLANVPQLGPISIKRVLKACAAKEDILYIEDSDIKSEADLTDNQYCGLLNAIDNKELIYKEYCRIIESDIDFVTIYESDYPEKLKTINDPPVILFYKGSVPQKSRHTVAIVGSRSGTNYGLNMASYISEELVKHDVDIISGLAVGIDGAAHRGALKAGGRSYGILGCGVNICYPRENFDIYCTMSEKEGCGIISEIVPGSCALSRNFPMRNRIISGLADAVIVIEAREKSGSLITAKMAVEQNRDVFALPGRITDPMSRGCNKLIAQGAYVLNEPSDVLNVLGLKSIQKEHFNEKNMKILAKNEKIVYSTLDLDPKYVQDIVFESKLSYSEVISALLGLELKGYITQISSDYYGIIY